MRHFLLIFKRCGQERLDTEKNNYLLLKRLRIAHLKFPSEESFGIAKMKTKNFVTEQFLEDDLLLRS